MKLYKSFMACAAAAVALCGVFTACDDDPDLPPMIVPESTFGEPNTTILDLKNTYWSSERNFADTVGRTPAGRRVIISGRVISCDSTGNIYKSLIIQDHTAALAISLDTTKLYMSYPVGQEVVIDMTGQFVGKYNGLFQMGQPEPYQNTYEISFMSYTPSFIGCAQRNGMPKPEEVDTVFTTIKEIRSWRSDDSIAKYQSQLICLQDVSFVGGGLLTWSDNGQNTNRQLRDAEGNTLTVRNSAYASFARETMPGGKGTVVCILSYYGTDWQLSFRTARDCSGFTGGSDDPSTPGGDLPAASGNGTAEAPYNVSSVIAGKTGTAQWVTGYIVGFVEGASISEGAKFSAENASQSNILLAATADETDVNNCVPIQLTYNTEPRNALNLAAHPENLGKQVSVCGDLQNYFNVKGVKNTSSYTWGDKGGDMPSGEPSTPADKVTFVKATKIESGKSYALVAGGKVALPIGKTYGYLPVADVTADGDKISADAKSAFTLTQTEQGWTIVDADGKYLYMTGSFNSFNLDDSAVEGAHWKVTVNTDGTAAIENILKSKTIMYGVDYTSFGAYSEQNDKRLLPTLYQKAD